jgi:hypothetical protein
MKLINKIFGIGCEFCDICDSYDKDSNSCNDTPYLGDGGSYCGIHRRLKSGKL